MYILLTEARAAAEIIPEIDPVFPGVPIEERYAPDFVQKLLHVADDTAVEQNWLYNEEAGAFAPPEEREEG